MKLLKAALKKDAGDQMNVIEKFYAKYPLQSTHMYHQVDLSVNVSLLRLIYHTDGSSTYY